MIKVLMRLTCTSHPLHTLDIVDDAVELHLPRAHLHRSVEVKDMGDSSKSVKEWNFGTAKRLDG
jgi:hypothetical protein